MQQEKMQVLKMLEEGKITAEDAGRLLDALPGVSSEEAKSEGGKRLRIRVTDPATGKQKVNLTIPVKLARIAAKFVPHKAKLKLADEGLDVDTVLSQVLSENIGKIVDVESDDGNVEISIE
jgi:hypothetical protein